MTEWIQSIESMLKEKQHPVSGLSNVAAVLWEAVPDINWVGFYFADQGALRLGPFQGKAACTTLSGHGVCVEALAANKTLVVPDVHAFPGHIACDAASRSEIVVPLRRGKAVGVLDVDSARINRFGAAERDFFEAVARLLEENIDFSRMGFDLQIKLEDDNA